MELLSITLKNFKSHSDRHFTFQPGTNAICGENGAGKTTILEAIAWTLFNYRGSYKNEDLIRNGASSAQVTVAFVSDRDGRTYEVQRCTTRGYSLYDPQLDAKLDYKHIDAEILPWLRQQLGVAPGTNLSQLFANTIGIPQGTYTADFLQPAEKRKPVFDAVLKVEEYRQVNQQMLSLEKYSKVEVETLERSIQHYEEALTDLPLLQQKQQDWKATIARDEATLSQLQQQLAQLQLQKDAIAAQVQQIQVQTRRTEQLQLQVDHKQQTIAQLGEAVQHSQQAVEICTQHRDSYRLYLQLEAELTQLQQQMRQRQSLQQQRDRQLQASLKQQTELARLEVQRDRLQEAAAELETLSPLVIQQEQLEQEQAAAIEQLNQLAAAQRERQTLQRQVNQLQQEQAQLQQHLDRLQALEPQLRQIPEWEQKRDRLQEQLSRVEAAKQFEAELRQLVTQGEHQRDRLQSQAESALKTLHQVQQHAPMGNVWQAIESGVAINTELINALWRILADLSEQIAAPKLQQQLSQLKPQLETAYQQRAAFATLAERQAQYGDRQQQIDQLQAQLGELQAQLSREPAAQQHRSQLASALSQLDNPRGRSRQLQLAIQQQPQLEIQMAQAQQQLAQLQATIAQLEQQLAEFAQIETAIDQQRQQQQQEQAHYLLYLQHQKDANQLATLQTALQAAIEEQAVLTTEQAALQTELDQLTQQHDPQQWQQLEAQYADSRSQFDRLSGSLPQQQQRLAELERQLVGLQSVVEKRDREMGELKQKEKVKRFISFARRAYKEAGPRITERYVQQISQEANRLFRELLARQNVALEWTRDYEIVVQEGAHSRKFQNLSGGEQMCAALSVRLALLRVLADIDIAFFDEPTTNMDRARRETLAEAIANIKTFRQLFVISHDDTFEKVTENVILVEREPG